MSSFSKKQALKSFDRHIDTAKTSINLAMVICEMAEREGDRIHPDAEKVIGRHIHLPSEVQWHEVPAWLTRIIREHVDPEFAGDLREVAERFASPDERLELWLDHWGIADYRG